MYGLFNNYPPPNRPNAGIDTPYMEYLPAYHGTPDQLAPLVERVRPAEPSEKNIF